jgi:Flp pilus assembly protein TadG
MQLTRLLGGQRGSSPVEFVLVGTLLTLLTLAVLQLALAVYVRNVAHDAAVEGAYHAALADTTLDEGRERARLVIARTVGDAYAGDIEVRTVEAGEQDLIEVTIRTTLPLIGLIGIPAGLEVNAHAPEETLGEG